MWLTSDIPGVGGTFTPSVDDFEVVETPLYDPCGEGDHLYLRIEKEGLTTRAVIQRIAQVFEVTEADIGYAGLKDRHARTTQTLSVRSTDSVAADRLEGDGVRVLWAKSHRNKLRVGHLAGNRFRAVIRNVGEGGLDRAKRILAMITERGLPNFYGEQRFGHGGANVEKGREVLRRGPRSAGSRWRAKLLVSSLQSALFNDYLRLRMGTGNLCTAIEGDLLAKVDSGGIFVCEQPEVDQPRVDAFEVSPTGPIFGWEMRRPSAYPLVWEDQVLAAASLEIDDFRGAKKLGRGTRRPLRAKVEEASATQEGSDLVVHFSLPAGSYATILLDEVVKRGRS